MRVLWEKFHNNMQKSCAEPSGNVKPPMLGIHRFVNLFITISFVNAAIVLSCLLLHNQVRVAPAKSKVQAQVKTIETRRRRNKKILFTFFAVIPRRTNVRIEFFNFKKISHSTCRQSWFCYLQRYFIDFTWLDGELWGSIFPSIPHSLLIS